ncbi:MAG: 2-oxoglutarate dehydrogenase E1 subunit family protein, partial [Actinomycetota bacterium]
MATDNGPHDGFGPNEWFVEELYQSWLTNPDSVDPAWSEYFRDYTSQQGKSAARATTTREAAVGRAAPSGKEAPPADSEQAGRPATAEGRTGAPPQVPSTAERPSGGAAPAAEPAQEAPPTRRATPDYSLPTTRPPEV